MELSEELEDIRRQVNHSADKAIEKINSDRTDLLGKIDQVKENQITRLITQLDARLGRIEAKLPDPEDEP